MYIIMCIALYIHVVCICIRLNTYIHTYLQDETKLRTLDLAILSFLVAS